MAEIGFPNPNDRDARSQGASTLRPLAQRSALRSNGRFRRSYHRNIRFTASLTGDGVWSSRRVMADGNIGHVLGAVRDGSTAI
jgi:hypothetical protein